MARPAYPQDKFDAAIEAMVSKISSGEMSIEQVVARCQTTGDLTESQLSTLEEAIPVTISDEE